MFGRYLQIILIIILLISVFTTPSKTIDQLIQDFDTYSQQHVLFAPHLKSFVDLMKQNCTVKEKAKQVYEGLQNSTNPQTESQIEIEGFDINSNPNEPNMPDKILLKMAAKFLKYLLNFDLRMLDLFRNSPKFVFDNRHIIQDYETGVYQMTEISTSSGSGSGSASSSCSGSDCGTKYVPLYAGFYIKGYEPAETLVSLMQILAVDKQCAFGPQSLYVERNLGQNLGRPYLVEPLGNKNVIWVGRIGGVFNPEFVLPGFSGADAEHGTYTIRMCIVDQYDEEVDNVLLSGLTPDLKLKICEVRALDVQWSLPVEQYQVLLNIPSHNQRCQKFEEFLIPKVTQHFNFLDFTSYYKIDADYTMFKQQVDQY